MRVNPRAFRWFAAVFILAAFTLAPAMAQRVPKKPISYDAYDSWRSIQGTQISRDGVWLAYALAAQEGDGELVVRNLPSGKEQRFPRGSGPVITADAKFVVYSVVPLKADVDKAKKDKKKPEEQPKNSLGILTLATGDVATVERVKSFKVAEDGSSHVAYLLEAPLPKPDEKKEPTRRKRRPRSRKRRSPRPRPRGQGRGRGEEAQGKEEGSRHGARHPRAGYGQDRERRRGRGIRLEQARNPARVRGLLQEARR